MTNELIHETSPYLLQHAHNPVDWYPWGEPALQKAIAEDKPILLSIGYAACHWCHVMAHESFEDHATAVRMNEHFINIKVDREERPDLDAIYMQSVVAMTGQGGWPMTVFLTPDGRPFYGGTYFPPVPRYGMPSFNQLLDGVINAWKNNRDVVERQADDITNHISHTISLAPQADMLDKQMLKRAVDTLSAQFDADLGGFGTAPKFPPSMTLEFLLRHYQQTGDAHALHMAEFTLEKMAYGGIYDQIGGGFARYATDAQWLIPHFEKMLYDNALLARVYLHAWQITGKPLYRRISQETLDFMAREMRHASGGLYSSYDADSEGVEGKFYVWTAVEIHQALGPKADLFMAYFGVSEQGNWEGVNILNIPRPPAELAQQLGLSLDDLESQIAELKQKLYAVRAQRNLPGLDNKVLTAWNGLAMAAFAEAGRAFDRPDYTAVAEENARFLYRMMRTSDGRLHRSWRVGSLARYNGYLEDYAYLADGLLALYQTTFEPKWFSWAQELANLMLTRFLDEEHGGFFDTADDHEALLHRPKEVQDNATPSGNSVAVHVLLRLSLYTGEGLYWDVAEKALSGLYGPMLEYPNAFAQWLTAVAFAVGDPQEVAIIGPVEAADTQALINTIFAHYRPDLIVAVGQNDDTIPLLAQRTQLDEKATAYVCRRFICQQPVTSTETLAQQLAM